MKLCRYFACVALISTILVAPWLFGGVQLKTQQLMWLVLGFGMGATSLACLDRQHTTRIPGLFWLLVAGLAFGAWQLVPLAPQLHEALSPVSSALWGTDEALFGFGSRASPISLYPHETRYNLTMLLGAVASFWIANRCFVGRSERLTFLFVTAINGCALTALGVAHYLTSDADNVIYWQIKLLQGGRPFASFVNRNHAGGYLNLCLAAAVALALWMRMQSSGRSSRSVGTTNRIWFWVASVASLILMLGVALSLSRSAVLGAVAGVCGLVFALASSERKRFAFIPLVLLALAVVGLVSTNRGEILIDRFQRGTDAQAEGTSSRFSHWADSIQASRDFPVFGAGLGTYRYIYRRYQSEFHSGWFYHAENQFVEAIVEGGLIGFGLLISAILAVSLALWHRVRASEEPESVALAVVGVFALLSQLAQSLFDFGLYLPANAGMLAAVCGLVLRPTDGAKTPHFERDRVVSVLMSGVLCGLLLLSTFATWGRADAEARVARARTIVAEPATAPLRVEQSTAALQNVMRRFPGDAEAARELARLQVIGYRLAALADLQESGLSTEVAWPLTSGIVIHRRVHESDDDATQRTALRETGAVADHLVPANHTLKRSILGCALIPEVHITLAQTAGIEPNWSRASEEWLLRTACELNPTDPDILFNAGLMQLQAGRVADGFTRWKEGLEASKRYVADATRLAIELGSIEQLMTHMLPAKTEALVGIAINLDASSYRLQRLKIADLAEQLLADVQEPAERVFLMSQIALIRRDTPARLEHLRQAVKLSPKDVERRFALASLLFERGLLDEAHGHAVICVRLAPHRAKFRQLRDVITRKMHETGPQ